MSDDQFAPMPTPEMPEDDLELEPEEQDVPNELKRSHAVIDLCDDEEEMDEAGLWGCPVCHEILDNLLSAQEAYEQTLRCTERYEDFVELAVPRARSRGLLRRNIDLKRSAATDHGVQGVRKLPGKPAPKNPKKGQ